MADTHTDGEPSLEQQVAILTSQLANAQKMTAIGELASTTTHEFNNILMTILNYAKMGIRHRDDETRDKALCKILDAAQRANRVTSSILGMARNRSDEMEPTDLHRLIHDAMVLLEREMNKYRIQVDLQCERVPRVIANGNQIQQVLLNLLINARQAMPEGGELRIRLSHDESSGTVGLTIRDNGSGIPGNQLPHIFDRFYSTKSGPDETGKGGTGLGLAACHDIIRAHRGKIRVESSLGKGTAFTIRLPVAATNGQPAPQLVTHTTATL